MKILSLDGDLSVHPSFFENLPSVSSAQFVPWLMSGWVTGGSSRSIQIASYVDTEKEKDYPVLVAFEQEKKMVAHSFIARSEMKGISRRYTPLPRVEKFADQSGHTVDESWFHARNASLKIKLNESFGEYLVPVAALNELVLSYLLSECAEVKIWRDLCENHRYEITDIYRLQLNFLGNDSGEGWTENVVVLKTRLDSYVQKNLQLKAMSGQQFPMWPEAPR